MLFPVALGQSGADERTARSLRSDRSNFSESLDCVFVVLADGGFPGGPRLRSDIVRLVVESGGVVRQHQVEVGNVDVRLVPVDSASRQLR
jgi:hypothetical protein